MKTAWVTSACVIFLRLVSALSTVAGPIRHYDFITNVAFYRSVTDVIRLSFSAFNRTFELTLTPNHNLLDPSASLIVHDGYEDDDTKIISRSRIPPIPAYHGHCVAPNGDRLGWASIVFESATFHSDTEKMIFTGAFVSGSVVYHVLEIDMYRKLKQNLDVEIASPMSRKVDSRTAKMILYTDTTKDFAALVENDPYLPFFNTLQRREVVAERSCGMVDPVFDFGEHHLERRQSVMTGCPLSTKILYMAAAGDCGFVQTQGSQEKALANILSNWNAVSALFQSQFNIQLGLVNVTLLRTCTPQNDLLRWNQDCSTDYPLSQRLSDFSRWRGTLGNDNAGLWHLVTKCGTGSAVGVAWLGALCQQNATLQREGSAAAQFVSGTGVSVASPSGWRVIAHEIGHNFGAIHDCISQNCPCSGQCSCCPCSGSCDCKGGFLMHPTDNSVSTGFSPCSQNFICSNFTRLGKCLKNPGELPQVTQNICGNGIKEGNEQCDCGVSDSCKNDPCCNWQTCTLKAGAKCSDKNDECCRNCQIRPAGFTCRPQNGPCDVPETCTGTSASCPADVVLQDGTSCSGLDGGTICASGYCTNRDVQCTNPQFDTIGQCPNMNLECSLTCKNATGRCVILPGEFMDGTPCGFGFGGNCKQGVCKSGNIVVDTLYSFLVKFPTIGVPILIVSIILVLVILLSIIRCLCCRNRRKARVNNSKMPEKDIQKKPNPKRITANENPLKSQKNNSKPDVQLSTEKQMSPSPRNAPSPRPPPNDRSNRDDSQNYNISPRPANAPYTNVPPNDRNDRDRSGRFTPDEYRNGSGGSYNTERHRQKGGRKSPSDPHYRDYREHQDRDHKDRDPPPDTVLRNYDSDQPFDRRIIGKDSNQNYRDSGEYRGEEKVYYRDSRDYQDNNRRYRDSRNFRDDSQRNQQDSPEYRGEERRDRYNGGDSRSDSRR